MAKKKDEAPVKTDGWKDTFSDLMNLLLCFFVLLFASSTVDAEKFQKIAQSMSESFSILKGGQTGIGEGILIASGASQLTELGEYYSELGKNEEGESDKITYAKLELDKEELKESTKMSENIERELAADKITSSVEVQTTTHYVQLTLKGSLLFDSARADLKPEAKELLKQVAQILVQYQDNTIQILGHTDNVPIIGDPLFTSNAVLSTYRALSVYEYLVNDCGLSPNNLMHSGFGEYKPIADNSTAEGRSQNRRVEIRIYNSYSSYSE